MLMITVIPWKSKIMAIFISYSHQDSGFVDLLAANLVKAKHHIWMDRWELNLGDSITEKIQQSLTGSDAILIILSKNSVKSDWCKREINAGLLRELEEKKTLVMPVLVEDCEIPLFLRDKLRADFTKSPDEAFQLIDRSLARISNPTMSRTENPDFFTDYSYDWRVKDKRTSEETWGLRFSFVDHSPKLPYVVVSECKIYQIVGSQLEDSIKLKKQEPKIVQILNEMHDVFVDKGDPSGLISDNLQQSFTWKFSLSDKEQYIAIYSYRRLGEDNGMDIVVHLGNNLKMARAHLAKTVKN